MWLGDVARESRQVSGKGALRVATGICAAALILAGVPAASARSQTAGPAASDVVEQLRARPVLPRPAAPANATLVNTAISARPARPNEALVAANTVGVGPVRYAWTADSGRSWHRRVLRGVTLGTGGPWEDASWAVPSAGLGRETYVVTSTRRGCDSAVVVARAADGRSFGVPHLVTLRKSCRSLTVKTWIAVDTGRSSLHRGRVHVSWLVFHDDADGNRVGQQQFVSHSDDRGRTWSRPLALSRRSGFTHFNSIVVQPDGAVTVSYGSFELDDPPDELGIVARTSTDGGETFAPAVAVTTNRLGFSGTPDTRCCMPTLAVDRGTGWMYLALGDKRRRDDDLNDILVWRSRDGSTWLGPVLASGRRDGGRSYERFTPSVGAHNGTVFVVWTRRLVRDGVLADLIQQEAVVSRDRGRSFGRPRLIGPPADIRFSPPAAGFSDRFTGDYTTTVAVPGRAYTSWARPVRAADADPNQDAWVAVLTAARAR